MISKTPLQFETEAKDLHESRSNTPPATTDVKPWEKPGLVGALRRGHRSVQRLVWDDPDKPKAEKWFLFKLDCFLLTTACLGYFSKGLDQGNISNAYVSGVSQVRVQLIRMLKSSSDERVAQHARQ